MRQFTILMLLSLTIASCQSGPEQITAPTPDVTFTKVTNVCADYRGAGLYVGEKGFYGTGFWPLTCDTREMAEGRYHYKLYFLLADGRRLLIGVDNNPFTVPTTEGPEDDVSGQVHNDGVVDGHDVFLDLWTFVISGPGTSFPLMSTRPWDPEWNDEAILVVELWGIGGKIGETLVYTDNWNVWPRGPKNKDWWPNWPPMKDPK